MFLLVYYHRYYDGQWNKAGQLFFQRSGLFIYTCLSILRLRRTCCCFQTRWRKRWWRWILETFLFKDNKLVIDLTNPPEEIRANYVYYFRVISCIQGHIHRTHFCSVNIFWFIVITLRFPFILQNYEKYLHNPLHIGT